MKPLSLKYEYIVNTGFSSDIQGQIVAKYNYDPWGRKRNPNTWDYEDSPYSQVFDRGYTTHQHLDEFRLINMPVCRTGRNGRLYDPWLGRMLSPDPFVQNATNTQNFNRYSYAINNPLKYIDPSGYHHGPVAKPEGWTSNGGGAIFINQYFSNGYGNRFDFSASNNAANNYFGFTNNANGMLVRNTPSYNRHSGYYTNPQGETIDYSDVFNNFVEPNSLSVSDIIFTGTTANPYQNLRGVFFSNGSSWYTGDAPLSGEIVNIGSAGGGDGFLKPIESGDPRHYQNTSVDIFIRNYREKASFALAVESTMITLATYGNTTKSVQGVSGFFNYFGAVAGMVDNSINSYEALMHGNIKRAQFEAAQVIMFSVAGGMLRSRYYAPIGGAIIFGNGLIDIGQYYYDNY